ncbi:hypothetical protein SapgrDRAFT_2832 [Saprospira grandis DSM 2844]|uniref:Uncharacterized protein n=1 Tax=Saprospira grandis DSM 2844 TaxID=694433 RepID=J0XZ76_9BACT|nr:hypothetical protein SapgrDRAFT_2832 [Saprospira grandis DSM 2844]
MFFWGCPSLRLGRAVSQLAIRSALRRKAPRSGPAGHCCPSLSLRRLRRLLDASKKRNF